MHRLSTVVLLLFLALSVVACDGGDLEVREVPDTLSPVVPPDVADDAESLLTLAPVAVNGASASGNIAEVRSTYVTDLPEIWFVRGPVELHVRVQSADVVHSTVVVDVAPGEQTGQIDLHLPADTGTFELIGTLYQPRLDRIIHRMERTENLVLDLVQDPVSSVDKGAEIFPVFVPGSYRADPVGNRMVHRFSLQVFDRHPDDPQRISIGGLHTDTERFFKAYENGYHDVESPITADATRNRLQIYFVLDASYSIVASGAEDLLKQAASRSVLALRDVAEYDYRQFSGRIRALDSLGGIVFDSSTSATALYHALDDTLTDIESFGAATDHKIIIAFTDGRDFSSLNYYPELTSDMAMESYITDRVRKVRDKQAEIGGGLQLHMVSVADADTVILDRLAIAGDGVHQSAAEWSGVGDAFSEVSRRILSTYFLEYSSQRVGNDLTLEVEVDISGNPARVTINP
ncbi:MAG: hypothetical protein KTR33_16595 [Gammaproteobacteria bacterium]|nr:hypothetical protein [Gammaproteobacteria bacterium]